MRIDHALIADYAEIVNGKLYLAGGGWEALHGPKVPHQLRIGIAVGVRIDWDETNRPITVTMFVENEDGQQLARIDGRMQVGRPSHLLAGASQLTQIAVNAILQLPSFAVYQVRISVTAEGLEEQTRHIPFRLIQQQSRQT